MTDCKERCFPEIKFGGFDNYDSTIAFYLRINALINKSDILLDFGCGRGEYQYDHILFRKELRILRGKVDKVIGLDVDTCAAGNPFVDEFHLLESQNACWPITDQSINLILADWTLEHISDPILFFKEVVRVLKPGGYFCARTTNSWGYVAIAAKILPKKYHSKVIQKVQKIRKEEDIFLTKYTCNSIPVLKKLIKENGLTGVVFGYSGLPAYLNFSCFLFYLGFLYEKFAPNILRHTLMIFTKKI